MHLQLLHPEPLVSAAQAQRIADRVVEKLLLAAAPVTL